MKQPDKQQENQANKRSGKKVQSVRQAKQQANKKLDLQAIEFYLPVKIGVQNFSASISARSGASIWHFSSSCK